MAVLKVVAQHVSVTTAAAECGLSRGHLHRLLRRYREGGLDALERRSRPPRTNPRRTPDAVPNECWQSDFTHWWLADGSELEIIDWLDDHSRCQKRDEWLAAARRLA